MSYRIKVLTYKEKTELPDNKYITFDTFSGIDNYAIFNISKKLLTDVNLYRILINKSEIVTYMRQLKIEKIRGEITDDHKHRLEAFQFIEEYSDSMTIVSEYSEYIVENTDSNIKYAEYIADRLNK